MDSEERVALVETKLSALEMVRRANQNKIGQFNKQVYCPPIVKQKKREDLN